MLAGDWTGTLAGAHGAHVVHGLSGTGGAGEAACERRLGPALRAGQQQRWRLRRPGLRRPGLAAAGPGGGRACGGRAGGGRAGGGRAGGGAGCGSGACGGGRAWGGRCRPAGAGWWRCAALGRWLAGPAGAVAVRCAVRCGAVWCGPARVCSPSRACGSAWARSGSPRRSACTQSCCPRRSGGRRRSWLAASASRLWARASCSAWGRDKSLARIAASTVTFMPAIAVLPGPLSAITGQKMVGHQGAGSHESAVESPPSAPARRSAASPAAARAPSLVPPR